MFKLFQKRVFGNRGGFTLVEVVIASSIMLIVFTAVLGTFSYGRRSASLTENRLYCLHIARQVLESLGNESYGSTDLATGSQKTLPGFPAGRGYYTVTESSGTKDVTVVIQWTEPLGMTQSVSLTTSFSSSLHP